MIWQDEVDLTRKIGHVVSNLVGKRDRPFSLSSRPGWHSDCLSGEGDKISRYILNFRRFVVIVSVLKWGFIRCDPKNPLNPNKQNKKERIKHESTKW